MKPLEALAKAMEYNKTNEKFAPLDDSDLGERISGGFSRIKEDEGHVYKYYIFDNGEQFCLDIKERMLYPCKDIPGEYFIHKYIERIVYDLKQNYQQFLNQENKEVKFSCSKNEIELQSSIVVRFVLDRNAREVCLTNICLPPQLCFQGIGLQLISQVYSVCKAFGYRLLIVGMVETFYNRMVKRGGIVIAENDVVEITDKTNLGRLG